MQIHFSIIKTKKRVFVREARPRSSKDDAGNRRRGKEHNGRDSKNVTKKVLVQELELCGTEVYSVLLIRIYKAYMYKAPGVFLGCSWDNDKV